VEREVTELPALDVVPMHRPPRPALAGDPKPTPVDIKAIRDKLSLYEDAQGGIYVVNPIGDDAHVLLEADVNHGVRIVPLRTYAGLHTRICRPVGLLPEEIARVIDYAMARVGDQYDMRHIWDLARYIVPMPPVPTRWRRRMLALGSGDPTRAICSTLIAEAFQSVDYPILPEVRRVDAHRPGEGRVAGLLGRLVHRDLAGPVRSQRQRLGRVHLVAVGLDARHPGGVLLPEPDHVGRRRQALTGAERPVPHRPAPDCHDHHDSHAARVHSPRAVASVQVGARSASPTRAERVGGPSPA
jgi:hypothetical protein